MIRRSLGVVTMLSIIFSPLAFAGSAAGLWKTIDDKTGKPKAIVRIADKNNTLSANIVRVFPAPGNEKICSKCPGAQKNKPFIGLQFAWGLKNVGENEWANGQIMDPKTGKIYRAKMTLKGDKLYVRGYIGLSILGRTQTWIRA